MIAGVDFIPLGELPEGVPVATNGGGYAESMAEHALAMALAAAKRLVLEHENLKRGQFNQFERNRMLAGGLCGIFGFGGIGAATARLMRGIGMRVHAINRHGRTDQQVDWIGTPERLNELLEAADVSADIDPMRTCGEPRRCAISKALSTCVWCTLRQTRHRLFPDCALP